MRATILSMSLALLCFLHIQSSLAQQGFNHCDDAQHSGDVFACINKHHDEITKKLNTTYEAILQKQDIEKAEQLRDTQTRWLTYRDQECAWEQQQQETQSLQRLKKISCLTRLTEQRNETLEKQMNALQANEAQTETDYRSAARWINVLGETHPDIFWRYGQRISVDLDCDGQNEEIMLGHKIQPHSKDTANEGNAPYNVKTLIAVSENPATGRPSSELLEVNLEPKQDSAHICDPNINVSITAYPKTLASAPKKINDTDDADVVKYEDKKEKTASCTHGLRVKSANCGTQNLFWTGEQYNFTTE